ncbi:MAG: metallopeptidase family protein [Archangium sp.]|nr:metallopeptidase family protein [Archangium sp.]
MRALLGFVTAAVVGCTCRHEAPPAAVCPPATSSRLDAAPTEPVHAGASVTAPPHAHHLIAVCEAKGQLPLDAAHAFFDDGHFDEALACAAQASALQPGDVHAHVERANALAALERFDEARLAFARALAIDPDDPDALLAASHFYGVVLPSTRELDELASLYAERGFEQARAKHDDPLAVDFARIGAMAMNDLGQASEALERTEWVLTVSPKDPEASYERAVALFELLRFDAAKVAFEALRDDEARAAHVHQHLGLIAEREDNASEAKAHFARAHALASADFPEPVLLEPDAFREAVEQAMASLPVDMLRDLTGVPVQTADVPTRDDLLSADPPLSPSILGLFRGPPLKEACEPAPDDAEPCRSIVLYRKNLARAVRTDAELREQIRVTLLHELGHLRGEDDFELAARGLE